MKLSELLKARRDERRLTRGEVVILLAAEGVEITSHALQKWEQNQRQPRPPALRALCRVLHISSEDIGDAMLRETP